MFFMKTLQWLIISFCIAFSFLSCNQNSGKEVESKAMADSAAIGYISSSAAVNDEKDSLRKFIRTAELKFKVDNVIESTYNIESIAKQQGGFVTFTNLTSEQNNFNTVAVSADSSLETTYITITNLMTIRVPNNQLDTTLKEIAKNIKFLDYRIIKAQDIALNLLENQRKATRSATNANRLQKAIDNKGKKLGEITVAEEALLHKQLQEDNAEIANLALNDQVNFSTINLSIYQRQTINRELVLNEQNIASYEPGFGAKVLDAFRYGWDILASFIVTCVKLWGLILFFIVAYIIFKFYKRTKK